MDILGLTKVKAVFGKRHLNAKKIIKRAEVFDCKSCLEMGNEIENRIRMATRHYDIIHIDKKNNGLVLCVKNK